jgi:hypothetical protein
VHKWAGLPRIVLHGARHTRVHPDGEGGRPFSIVSRWAGNYDASFTHRQHMHADHAEDLRQGATVLGKLYEINWTV